MIISQIVAISRNRVIGKDNKLPWHMPDDLAYFFRMTRGRHIIIGRKNFEANGKALPDRVNIVVTRRNDYEAPGCIIVHSPENAIQYARSAGEKEAFISGGSGIYRATLDITDRIYLTLIDAEVEGDVFYPKLNMNQWRTVSEIKHKADARNKYDYTYFIFERLKRK
jgi:dihydrofolate reductase